jgi:hypothetical protein
MPPPHPQGDRTRARQDRQARDQRRARPDVRLPRALLQPGYEIKSLAIGLAAGIIFDATVIRARLVPALMRLPGDANWWMPRWAGTALRVPKRQPVPEMAAASP